MTLLHIIILAPFILAILVPFLYKTFRNIHTGWFVLPLPILSFTYLLQFISNVSGRQPVTATVPWIPALDIHFTVYVDGLGLLFALLITGIGALVVLYSIYYLSKKTEALNNFYVYLLMFMGAMLGVVLSDNLMVLYVFWELTSLASALLIAYWFHREKSLYGALKSTLITVSGGFAMLAGFILLYVITGTFSIRELIGQADVVAEHTLFLPAMLLILVGAFTKSAQFPFHIWLPDAMEAPTPVSAYLHSATMVKAGIYLVARLTPVFAGGAEWFWLVSGFGIVTLFWGSFSAVKQTDLKSILAFSTVSQLGLIMCLLGLGSAAMYYGYGDESLIYTKAVLAAMFHLINHATFKGCLFMVVGIVDHETGTRDIRKLGGLMTLMPITFTLAVIGGFSMAGLPPFNGFLSKEMFFTGVLLATKLDIFNAETWGYLFPVLGWIASVFTFVYCMILVFKTFTGKYQPEKLDKKPHEAPMGMLVPPIILASLVVVFGFFPNILSYTILEPTMASILPALVGPNEHFIVHITFWHGFSTELFMTMGVVGLGTLLFVGLNRWTGVYGLFPQRLALNHLYDQSHIGLERFSSRVTRLHMTGFIRDYLAYIFAFFIVILLSALVLLNAFNLEFVHSAPISFYELILSVVMVIAACAIPLAKTRLMAIIAAGVVGYTLALFFVIFRAPDLALTQLIVETVSVTLFLLSFYHLPELKQEMSKVRFKLTNLLIALGVGLTVTLIAFSAHSTRYFESISQYFLEASYKEAGGKNVVNVILVDFRGFDTLLEILVLGIASLGIFALIKLRKPRGNES
ncbi:multicomponent Na+:H+ antiporter subunit A [Caldalkalibacillus uzonensis]|uniref:Multicomponent Na+:H+ antiporter subunit A n=1 Tax=Caldalkalibacillus uzonensis TaxID=353224 RepID=A0ABU0CTB3_9BACI|nr:Na+/H+ antiporter subunit A [Caldalkalibacillus uzonensis]MDQ0339584.1 multicomponent Na+:H+ antiporter subunit A [Caldalkalibacillus uzonensis]